MPLVVLGQVLGFSETVDWQIVVRVPEGNPYEYDVKRISTDYNALAHLTESLAS